MRKLTLCLTSLLVISCTQTHQDPIAILKTGKWIDLTYEFSDETIYWPTSKPFKHDTVFYGISENGYFYSNFRYSAGEHGGTHFDAPIHFGQGQNSIHEVPISQCIGEGIVIDVSGKALKNADYLVSIEDFTQWEEQYGQIPVGAIILLNTGFGKYWNNREKYIGTSKTGSEAVPELHFPGLHPEAAKWLTEERDIKAIGLDTPSIDFGQSTDFMAHQILCGHGLTIYENIANLEQVPARGSFIVALPMKIKGGSGAPLRIVAFVPETG